MRPKLFFLEDELIQSIVDEALRVLAVHGVLVHHRELLQRMADAGFRVDWDRELLFIQPDEARAALAKTPDTVHLYNRDGELHATLAGDKVHFTPASSALYILDHQTGKRRKAKTADLAAYARVVNGLQHIAYPSTAFSTDDVPQEIADAWRLYVILAHCPKPIVSGAFTPTGIPRMGELMQLFRKDREELRQKPMALFTVCPTSPLRWNEDSSQNLLDCTQWGIPVEFVPVALLGLISPVTPVGTVALHTAEIISGIVMAQTLQPGHPVVFGGAPAAFHMRQTTSPMTAVEALRIFAAYVQVGKALDLPTQAYLGQSDAKDLNMQAGAETFGGMILAALAGVNSASGPGMLDFVNLFSLSKLIFDDELAGQALFLIREMRTNEDLPLDSFVETVREQGHVLTWEHTLAHWPQELYLPGPAYDRVNLDQLSKLPEDQRTENSRLKALVNEAIAAYQGPPVDTPTHEEMRRILQHAAGPAVRLPELHIEIGEVRSRRVHRRRSRRSR
jgi:trimethylamine--corrinoid protein Co-methyltransferase